MYPRKVASVAQGIEQEPSNLLVAGSNPAGGTNSHVADRQDVTGLPAGAHARPMVYSRYMCRNIRVLHNFEPPTTDDEVREAALQFVRKVSGSTHPSRANTPAFDRAIEEIALATRRLLDDLVTSAPPKSREHEAAKGRERHEKRMEREVRIRTAAS